MVCFSGVWILTARSPNRRLKIFTYDMSCNETQLHQEFKGIKVIRALRLLKLMRIFRTSKVQLERKAARDNQVP